MTFPDLENVPDTSQHEYRSILLLKGSDGLLNHSSHHQVEADVWVIVKRKTTD